MLKKIKKLFHNLINRETLLYVLFGIGTTVINIVIFALFTKVLNINWQFSNAVAWICSVLFAFITNKIFVFESRDFGKKKLIFELFSFFAARLFSLLIEYGGLWLLIDVLSFGEIISKILMNVIVIIFNYVFSKLVIFRKKGRNI